MLHTKKIYYIYYSPNPIFVLKEGKPERNGKRSISHGVEKNVIMK